MTEKIILGGGCFWCMEAVFQMLNGVVSITSGYAGGRRPNPSYEEVSAELTGHAEVVEVQFDPTVIALDDLLTVFFTSHDPTSLNQQGADVGTQYRSAIYFSSSEQKSAIEAFVNKLTADHIFPKPIVTEIKEAGAFYAAEGYHQNYYQQNKDKPYCQAVINPKIAKLRQKYAHLLKQ